jgi:cytochrome c oxidase cbb3-type subunit 4
MDVNDFRGLWTLVSFLVFIGITLWAYSGARKERFAAAARLPLDDDGRTPTHQ